MMIRLLGGAEYVQKAMDSPSFGYLTNMCCISTLCQTLHLRIRNSLLGTLLTFFTRVVGLLWTELGKLPSSCHLDLHFQPACYPHLLNFWSWLSYSFLSFSIQKACLIVFLGKASQVVQLSRTSYLIQITHSVLYCTYPASHMLKII